MGLIWGRFSALFYVWLISLVFIVLALYFSIFFFVFPAALCLYSVINSGVSLGQQRYLYKKHGVLGDTQVGSGG